MAKARPKEGKNSKSHLKARQEYLHQAANYLQEIRIQNTRAKVDVDNAAQPEPTALNCSKPTPVVTESQSGKKPLTNVSRLYISQMRGVSQKTQTRLPIPVKRSYCKRCDTLLTSGVSCSHEIINQSRDRKKAWADVLVIHCFVCGTEKRLPQTQKRGAKLSDRQRQSEQGPVQEP